MILRVCSDLYVGIHAGNVRMSKMNNLVRLTAFYAVLAAAPASAFAYAGQELAPSARVSIDQARAIALKTVPGQITDEELEAEEGGSGLRYTFNIKRGASALTQT
jgi:uncharacterized membrane protein YkoI